MLLRIPLRPAGKTLAQAVFLTIALLPFTPAIAQDAIQPGEAFATRFSGTRPGAGAPRACRRSASIGSTSRNESR